MSLDSESLQRVVDRFAIQDALARYARGIDRRNWDVLRSAYHSDAYVDQGDYKGDVEGLIAAFSQRHAGIEQSAHLVANCLIEFDSPDGAVVETYFLALLRSDNLPKEMRDILLGARAGEPGKIDLQSLGRYLDRFERRAGEWRIARRVCVAETVVGDLAPAKNTFSSNWVVASREADDALWRVRKEFGLDGPAA
jgi:hypothetical protein